MLDNLTQRLAKVVKTMRGEARLTESNTADMLREVRLALLEADVALPAVREFIGKVKEKALGEEVIGSLSPGQALVGVVQRELASLMGAEAIGKTPADLAAARDSLAAWLASDGPLPAWPGFELFTPALPHSARHASIRLAFEAAAEAAEAAAAKAPA